MAMPERKFAAANEYRYGFNGKENDKDAGEGIQDYGMRIYSERLGRFLSVDPLTKEYPWYTPYQFAGNDVLRNIDLDGKEPFLAQKIAAAKAMQLQKTNERLISSLTVVKNYKCHPDGQILADKINLQIAKEYAKLDHANGQVDFPRHPFMDILFGKRGYDGNKEVGADGYLTGKYLPITGTPPSSMSFGRIGSLSSFKSFVASDVKLFVSTEEGAQDLKKVSEIKELIKSSDKMIWAERIDVVTVNNKTFILDGHNRLKAFSELGDPTKKASVFLMSVDDAKVLYKSKMDDILKGVFTTPINK